MLAPKVTVDLINSKIKGTTYTLLPNGRTTICQITLENGFTIEGQSACVCIENFDSAIGNEFAYKDAYEKIWQLEGYLLAEKLFKETVNV